MAIQQLPQAVQAALRNGIIVVSPAQSVVELVLNSLDAGATSIAVRVDLKIFKIQIVDNGCGMGLEQLDVLGPRYMTSKCHSLEDLQNNIVHYGFRGEALASLIEVSGLFVIISRPVGDKDTYCKAFTHGEAKKVVVSETNRPSNGTTITIHDFMCNLPVRRKRISEAIDLEEIRSHLECIALIHPGVSFSLRNDSKRSMILHKHKSPDLLTSFRHLFGQVVTESLAPVNYASEKFKVSGFIGKKPHKQKNLQFVYVNKRVIVKTKLNRLVNALLAKSAILRANGPWRHKPIPKEASNDWLFAVTASEKRHKFAVFMIHIECASKEYDVYLNPSKTSIEFEDWDDALYCVREAIRLFLERESLVFVEEASASNSQDLNSTLSGSLIKGHQEDKESNEITFSDRNEKTLTNSQTNCTNKSVNCNLDEAEGKRKKKEKTESKTREKSTRTGTDLNNSSEKEVGTFYFNRSVHGLTARRRNTVANYQVQISNALSEQNGTGYSVECSPDEKERDYYDNRNFEDPPHRDCVDQLDDIPLTQPDNTLDNSIVSKRNSISEFSKRNSGKVKSISKLQILNGAYMFKLEEVKQKINRDVSKTLLKYNFRSSVTKQIFKHGNKLDGNDLRMEVGNSCMSTSNSVTFPIPEFKLPNVTFKGKISFSEETKSYLPIATKPSEQNLGKDCSVSLNVVKKKSDVTSLNFNIFESKKSSHTIIESPYFAQGKFSTLDNARNILENSSFCSISSNDLYEEHEQTRPILKEMPLRTANHEMGGESNEKTAMLPLNCKGDFCTSNDFLCSLESVLANSPDHPECVLQQCSNSVAVEEFHIQDNQNVVAESLSNGNYNIETEKSCNNLSEICGHKHRIPNSNYEIDEKQSYLVTPDIFDTRTRRRLLKTPTFHIYKDDCTSKKQVHSPDNMEKCVSLTANCMADISIEEKEPLKDDLLEMENLNNSSEDNVDGMNIDIESVETIHLSNLESGTIEPIQTPRTLNISEIVIISIPSCSNSAQSVGSLNSELVNIESVFNSGAVNMEPVLQTQNTGSLEEVNENGTDLQSRSPECLKVVSQLSAVTESCELEIAPSSEQPVNTKEGKNLSSSVTSNNCGNQDSDLVVHIESPYFTSKQMLPKVVENETDTVSKAKHLKFCGKKRNSGEIVTDMYGKRVNVAPIGNSECEADFSSRNVTDANDNMSCSVSTDEFLNAYDSAIKLIDYSKHWQENSKNSDGMDIVERTDDREDASLNNLHNEQIGSDKEKAGNPIQSSDQDIVNVQKDNLKGDKSVQKDKIIVSSDWMERINHNGKMFYVNSRSGMTLCSAPVPALEQNLFNMTERYSFLPKGVSPMLKDVPSNRLNPNNGLTPSSRDALHSVIMNSADLGDELATVKWKDAASRPTGSKELIKTLLVSAENRMQFCEKPVPGTSCDGISKLAVKMSSLINYYKCDKDIFTNIQVLKQWDEKFIVTVVSLEKGKRPHMIGVFDQHAVHERIRLEALMKEYVKDPSNSQFYSTEADPQVTLDLSGKDVRILSSFEDNFERIGLKFEILNETSVKILKIPTCLHTRELRERSRGTSVIKTFLQSLIQEQVDFILRTRGSGSTIPHLLQEIINYEACRGAIKFGDSLTNEDCEALLTSLSQCSMPFYCAHGRPSFVPLFDLMQFKMQDKLICK